MDGHNDDAKRLANFLRAVAAHEGIQRTLFDDVWVARHSKPQPCTPVVYEPMNLRIPLPQVTARALASKVSSYRSGPVMRMRSVPIDLAHVPGRSVRL